MTNQARYGLRRVKLSKSLRQSSKKALERKIYIHKEDYGGKKKLQLSREEVLHEIKVTTYSSVNEREKQQQQLKVTL